MIPKIVYVFAFVLLIAACFPLDPSANVDTPTFDPAPGTFDTTQIVSIACITPGSTIYVANDEDSNTGDYILYEGPIAVSSTTALRVYATRQGMNDSDTVFGTFTIQAVEVSDISLFSAVGRHNRVELHWSKPQDATGVLIKRSQSGFPISPEDGSLVVDTTGSSHIDLGLENDMTYYYAAFAYDQNQRFASGVNVSGTPHASGSLDVTFGGAGAVYSEGAAGGDPDSPDSDDEGLDIAVDRYGRIVVAGYSYNGIDKDMAVWRYNRDGTPDNSFGGGGIVIFDGTAGGSGDDDGRAVAINQEGKIVVTGSSYNGTNLDLAIWQLNDDGTLDHSFGNDGALVTHLSIRNDWNYYSWDAGNDIVIDDDGKIVVTGFYNHSSGGNSGMAIWRFNSDGNPDPSFNDNGYVKYQGLYQSDGDSGWSIAIDGAGNILAAGYGLRYTHPTYRNYTMLMRYTPSGLLDVSFDGDGIIEYDLPMTYQDRSVSIALDLMGKATFSNIQTIFRHSADGSLDDSFGSNGFVDIEKHGLAFSVINDSVGRLYAVGKSWDGSANGRRATIWHYDQDGVLDSRFGENGRLWIDTTESVGPKATLDDNGSILVVGYKQNDVPNRDMAIWRVNP